MVTQFKRTSAAKKKKKKKKKTFSAMGKEKSREEVTYDALVRPQESRGVLRR